MERVDQGHRIAHFSSSWKIEDVLETYPLNWLNPFSEAHFNELIVFGPYLNTIKIEHLEDYVSRTRVK